MKPYFRNIVIERPRRGVSSAFNRSLGTALRFRPHTGSAEECEDWYDTHPESVVSNAQAKRGFFSRGGKKIFGATKEFTDMLSPLRRFLHSRTGELWDNVYSEIRQEFRNGGMAQEHALGHLMSYVTTNVVDHGGKFLVYGEFGISDLYGYYVHPHTGRLEYSGKPYRYTGYPENFAEVRVNCLHHPKHTSAFVYEGGLWYQAVYQKVPTSYEHAVTKISIFSNYPVVKKFNGFSRQDPTLLTVRSVSKNQLQAIALVLAAPRLRPARNKRKPGKAVWLMLDYGYSWSSNYEWSGNSMFAHYANINPDILWG